MDKDVMAIVSASPPRRWLGVGMMGLLGVIVLYVAIATPPDAFQWQAFLIVVGIAALVLADKTRRATDRTVELTATGLQDNTGEQITTIDNIERVNRGMFAMKPSNGFTLVLKEPRARRWLPGLWWSMGRRVGIGGVTPGSQTKFMAQMIEAMIAERAS